MSTKLATMRFIKLIVDANKSIFGANKKPQATACG
jgi:hypothetical protein